MNKLMETSKSLKDSLETAGFGQLLRSEIVASSDLDESVNSLAAVFDDCPSDGKTRKRFYTRIVLPPSYFFDNDEKKIDLSEGSPLFLSSDYWQSAELNPKEQGRLRKFAAVPQKAAENQLLQELLKFDLAQVPFASHWKNFTRNPIEVGIHLVRLVATSEHPGVSSPNMPHRDGEFYTFIHLIRRHGVTGGESLVFKSVKLDGQYLRGPQLLNTTLVDPLDSLGVWDLGVYHDVTPIEVADGFEEGIRDVVLIDFKPLEGLIINAAGSPCFDMASFPFAASNPVQAQ